MKKTLSFALMAIFILGLGVSLGAIAPQAQAGITIPTGTGLPEPTTVSGFGPVVDVVASVLRWILGLFLLLAIISFVISGIMYLFSFGDPRMAEKAKSAFTYSIIAVAAVGGSLIIVQTIDLLLS